MTWKVVPGSPVDKSPRAPHPESSGKEAAAHQRPLVRVLIVDDEPSICKALLMLLSRSGYEAIAAQSGDSALSIIRNEHVDVMLIDLRIPDMRGDVIFEVAAGHQPHLRYQTLFMTGDITDRAHKLIAACKCNFLRKPFDLRDVTDAVSAVSPRIQQQDAG
ncbi:MAG TPA: response regulator [Gemmatimonadaceae bacterium]|jgi:DNA-binding NtrC family response regulator